MVIKTQKGCFEVLKNVRNALNVEKFESLYIEEMHDKYNYFVLDVADEKIRVKGFKDTSGHENSYEYIIDYVLESCNYLAPFAILKRVDDAYYDAHKEDKETDNITSPLGLIEPIEKENFDKNTIRFEHTMPNEKNIDLSSSSNSEIKLYELPETIKDEIARERLNNNRQNHKKFSNQNSKTKVFSHKNSN